MRPLASWLARLLIALISLCLSGWAMAQQSAASTFTREQIDQMMAPIALYPDSLLSQVLMASTYPADVAEAAKWSKSNAVQSGDAAVKAVQNRPWDPSVQSLIAFPQVIQMMGAQPDWVQNLGDAFLASPKDVLDSAQRLRGKAQQQGSLKTNEQQKVVIEQEPQTLQSVILIEPANPEVIYVPAYDPTVVYGEWPYPAYPPYYYPPADYGYWYPGWYPGTALATGIAFGVGVAAVGALWGNCNWGGGNVNINVNRYNAINANRQLSAGQDVFRHNAANRRGVPYRDARSQQQFGRNVPGAEQRADFRGRDNAAREAQRQGAQSALQQRGMDPAQGRQDLRNDPAAGERAQRSAAGNLDRGARAGDQIGNRAGDLAAGQARAGDRATQLAGADRSGQIGPGGRNQGLEQVQSRPATDNALRGAGSAAQTRQQVDRGTASRQSMANHGAARGGGYGSATRPSGNYGAGRAGRQGGARSGGNSGASRGGRSSGGGGRGGGSGGGGGRR